MAIDYTFVKFICILSPEICKLKFKDCSPKLPWGTWLIEKFKEQEVFYSVVEERNFLVSSTSFPQ